MTISTVSLICGFIGSMLFITSCFSITRNRIFLLGIISSIVLILGYFLKSDITAATMVIIALTRNTLFLIEDKISHRFMTKRNIALFMIPVIIIAWGFNINFSSFHSYQIIILICPLLMAIGFAFQNLIWLKIFTILNGAGWLTYELITGAYGVMIGEATGIVMAGIALWRISTKIKNQQKNLNQI